MRSSKKDLSSAAARAGFTEIRARRDRNGAAQPRKLDAEPDGSAMW